MVGITSRCLSRRRSRFARRSTRRDATPRTAPATVQSFPSPAPSSGFVSPRPAGAARCWRRRAGTAPPSSSRRRPPRSVSVSSTARWISRTTRRRCSSARCSRRRGNTAQTFSNASAPCDDARACRGKTRRWRARSPPRTSSRFSRRAPRRRACERRCADTRCDFSTRFAPSTANSSDDSRTRRCTGVSRGSGWTSPRAR